MNDRPELRTHKIMENIKQEELSNSLGAYDRKYLELECDKIIRNKDVKKEQEPILKKYHSLKILTELRNDSEEIDRKQEEYVERSSLIDDVYGMDYDQRKSFDEADDKLHDFDYLWGDVEKRMGGEITESEVHSLISDGLHIHDKYELQNQISNSPDLGEEEKRLLLNFSEKRGTELTKSWKKLLEERKFEARSGHAAPGVKKMLENPENASLSSCSLGNKDIEIEL